MPNGGNPASGARILAVRLGALGDIVHTLPAVASLKHSFPTSRLTWLVEPAWAALLEGNPFVDRVALLPRDRPAAAWATLRQLRAERFDLAVDFQGLVKSALAASLARPDRIFGFARPRERAAALVYSNRAGSAAAHVVDRNLDLAAAAGASSLVRAFPLPSGRPEGRLPEGPFVLACPLAGWRSKQWPLEYYARLAAALPVPLVLNVPPEGRQELAGVANLAVHASGLAGLLDALRRAAAFVGVDSGPMHLAAALGRPGVAIFGPTDPARNGPYSDAFTVLRSPRAVTSYKRRPTIDPAMLDVTPDAVAQALHLRLARRPQSAGCLA